MTGAAWNPEYIKFCISTSLATGQYEELEKRLKYTPFDDQQFRWWLMAESSPMFFVIREFLRRGNYVFSVCGNPLTLTSLENSVVITPWNADDHKQPMKVRGQYYDPKLMGLYYEAGDWDCPQFNPLFDWTEAQAWGYLTHSGLIDAYAEEFNVLKN